MKNINQIIESCVNDFLDMPSARILNETIAGGMDIWRQLTVNERNKYPDIYVNIDNLTHMYIRAYIGLLLEVSGEITAPPIEFYNKIKLMLDAHINDK